MNSRGSQLSVADYELNFVKQVMTMPTVKGFVPAPEAADKKYYYAVVNMEDYQKILTKGAIPVGRKLYYPLNWSHNPTEAVRFFHYLKKYHHERAWNTICEDFRLIAMPLNEKATTDKKEPLKMRSFNRHYGGFYEHYEADKERYHANEVLNYMLANPEATTIELGTPMPQDETMASTRPTMGSSSSGTMTSTS